MTSDADDFIPAAALAFCELFLNGSNPIPLYRNKPAPESVRTILSCPHPEKACNLVFGQPVPGVRSFMIRIMCTYPGMQRTRP
jgi:hypothetical protein